MKESLFFGSFLDDQLWIQKFSTCSHMGVCFSICIGFLVERDKLFDVFLRNIIINEAIRHAMANSHIGFVEFGGGRMNQDALFWI